MSKEKSKFRSFLTVMKWIFYILSMTALIGYGIYEEMDWLFVGASVMGLGILEIEFNFFSFVEKITWTDKNGKSLISQKPQHTHTYYYNVVSEYHKSNSNSRRRHLEHTKFNIKY